MMVEIKGSVVAVCVSERSGLPRPCVDAGELREGLGFAGNKHSVGGSREVCLFDSETYASLLAEGAGVEHGIFGENLVTQGIPFGEIRPGDRLIIGDSAEIRITMVRKPCSHLTQIDPRFPESLVGRSGWMASVVCGGTVRPGDSVRWVRE